MNTRLATAFAALAVALAAPAAASMLYKSVDPNGTITFSDMPPPEGSVLLEQRAMGMSGSSVEPAPPLSSTAMEDAYQMIDSDQALREANERVDLAEHALALARSGHAPTARPGLVRSGLSLEDAGRIEFHKRDLHVARQALIELLRSRQLASGNLPQ